METDTHRPNPSLANNQSEKARMYEETISRLEELALKRFWTLEPENELRARFLVKDQLGREVLGASHLYAVRGFFASLPYQA
ncbi:MAG: hypothetical protein EBT07_07095 [Actinobacteria bacterium]|nr:hypothetical protein [Actinomycetota bacterium]